MSSFRVGGCPRKLCKSLGITIQMEFERISILDLIMFVIAVAAFIIFGQAVGWRVAGILQLIFSIRVIRNKEVGMGWEGFKPSFYLRGKPAIALGVVSLCVAVILLFFPEKTIMKWSS